MSENDTKIKVTNETLVVELLDKASNLINTSNKIDTKEKVTEISELILDDELEKFEEQNIRKGR